MKNKNTCKYCKHFVKKDKLNGLCKVYKLNRIIENSCINYEKKDNNKPVTKSN